MFGTWHDSTWASGDGDPYKVEVNFNGSGIYVYFILPNTVNIPKVPATLLETSVTFKLDGELVGSFDHNPDDNANSNSSTGDFDYNQLVYSNSSILPSSDPGLSTQHSLVISTRGTSLILFDYALRT